MGGEVKKTKNVGRLSGEFLKKKRVRAGLRARKRADYICEKIV